MYSTQAGIEENATKQAFVSHHLLSVQQYKMCVAALSRNSWRCFLMHPRGSIFFVESDFTRPPPPTSMMHDASLFHVSELHWCYQNQKPARIHPHIPPKICVEKLFFSVGSTPCCPASRARCCWRRPSRGTPPRRCWWRR